MIERLVNASKDNGNGANWISIGDELPSLDKSVLLVNKDDLGMDEVVARRKLKKELPFSLREFVDDDGYFEVQGAKWGSFESLALPCDYTHWQYV